MVTEDYPLQRILFPTTEIMAAEKLYFRVKPYASWRFKRDAGLFNFTDGIPGAQILEFNTFFGALSLTTWCGPADLDEVGLELDCHGVSTLRLWHDRGEDRPYLLFEGPVNGKPGEWVQVRLAGLQGKRGVLYPEVEAHHGKEFTLRRARYITPQAPRHPVRLAIVMPTYKRESYVLRNVAIFRESLAEAGLQDAVELIIVDNGRTLDISVPKGVRIIRNRNFGGAGGFARGLIEVLEAGTSISHVLFCDDDVQIEPESVHRIYRLLGYIDDTVTVGGGMLNMDEKQRLHELGALFRKMTWTSGKHHLDMTQISNVVNYDAPEACNYFGWWFYAASVQAFRDNGFPLPFFVRGDDQEFGLRLCKQNYPMISLLGCAVWHEEFHKKDPPLMWYYMMRNNLITSLLYETNFLNGALFECARRILMMMLLYRYEHAEYMIDGLKDALEGPDFFRKTNPETLHGNKIQAQELKPVPIPRSEFVAKKFDRMLRSNFLKRLLIFLTLNGHLVPPFVMKEAENPNSEGWAIETLHSRRFQAIFRCPVVLYYEPTAGEGILCRIDRKRFFKIALAALAILPRLVWKHRGLRSEWKAAHADLTSLGFWKRHLGLKA